MKARLLLALLGFLGLLALGLDARLGSAPIPATAQLVPAASFQVEHAGDGRVRWRRLDGAVPGGPVVAEEGLLEASRGEPLRLRVQVGQGDRVEAGAELARLEQDLVAAREAAAEAELRAQEAERQVLALGGTPEAVRLAEREVEVARAALAQARAQVARLSSLQAQGALGGWEVEDARLLLELRTAELTQAQAGVALARQPARAEELELAEAATQAARARLEEARAARAAEVLRSPLTGRVEQPGGEILVRVDAEQAPVLQLAIEARALPRLRPGLSVEFRPSGSDALLHGRLVALNPTVRALGERAVVWATAALDEPTSAGPTGSARILGAPRE